MRSVLRTMLVTWLLVFATSAAAQTLVTLTTTGTMRSGTDLIGLFTAPGSDLANLPFTLSMTGDPSYLTDRHFAGGHVADADGFGLPVMFRGELTINGRSYTWQLHHGWGSIDLLASASGVQLGISAGTTSPDESLDGNAIYMSEGADSTLPAKSLAHGTDFDQTIELTDIQPPAPYNVLFSVQDASNGTLWTGGQGVATYALWTVSPVPEPAAGKMLLAGIGLLASLLARPRRFANGRRQQKH